MDDMRDRHHTTTILFIISVAALIAGIFALIMKRSSPDYSDEISIGNGLPLYSPDTEQVRIPVKKNQLHTGRDLIGRIRSISDNRNTYAILVDKSAFTLYVYKDGKNNARFPIELGWNPLDPKERRGDGCTPEGLYEITWKRDIGSTEFHRALLLNYPNDNDRENGRTGGAIEIHGCGTGLRPGDGGENWTAGCIALSNECIDSLFMMTDGNRGIDSGTPVGIVYAGSLHDTEYEINN